MGKKISCKIIHFVILKKPKNPLKTLLIFYTHSPPLMVQYHVLQYTLQVMELTDSFHEINHPSNICACREIDSIPDQFERLCLRVLSAALTFTAAGAPRMSSLNQQH